MSYFPTKKVSLSAQPAMGDWLSDAVNAVGSLVATGTSAFIGLAAPRFTMVNGVAKPTDNATLELFKALQSQMNRVASKKKIATIAVDGKIGTNTSALMKAVVNAAAADHASLSSSSVSRAVSDKIRQVMVDIVASGESPKEIAANALGLYGNIKQYADWIGSVPVASSPKPASPPAVYNPTTKLDMPQPAAASMSDAWGRLGTGTQLVAVAAVAGTVGYLLLTTKKKKKRK